MASMETKRCKACGVEREITRFHRGQAYAPDGRRSICTFCMKNRPKREKGVAERFRRFGFIITQGEIQRMEALRSKVVRNGMMDSTGLYELITTCSWRPKQERSERLKAKR